MSFSYLSGYTAAVKNIHQQVHKRPTKISSTSEVLSTGPRGEGLHSDWGVGKRPMVQKYGTLQMSLAFDAFVSFTNKVPEQGTMMSGISIILFLKTFFHPKFSYFLN